jgi:hypothetical protein
VRFLGRRVYLGAVVVLAGVMMQGATPRRIRELSRLLGGVSRRTLERWRRWWRESLPATSLWLELRGQLRGSVDEDALPRALLDRLGGEGEGRLVALLRLLLPLSNPRSEHAR